MEEFCEGCGDGEICCQWWPVCEPVGEEIASFSDLCFWYNCDPDLTGPNTEAMQVKATYTDAGWDFLGECANGTYDRWRMCVNGVDYPHLNWEFSQRGDFLCPNGTAMEDLAYLAKRWMANTPARIGVADINGDGKVNLNDFAILASHWLQG